MLVVKSEKCWLYNNNYRDHVTQILVYTTWKHICSCQKMHLSNPMVTNLPENASLVYLKSDRKLRQDHCKFNQIPHRYTSSSVNIDDHNVKYL